MGVTVYEHTLVEPKQWRAGYVGAERKPFYFNCCQCGAHEPIIAGFLSGSETPDFDQILIYPVEHGFYKLALYCGKCWAERHQTRKEERNLMKTCYYGTPDCRGRLWKCKTCGESYCQMHWHETSKGRNRECVACERKRLETEAEDRNTKRQICCKCGKSVAPGSGKFVNRVPELNDVATRQEIGRPFPHGEFVCAECDQAKDY